MVRAARLKLLNLSQHLMEFMKLPDQGLFTLLEFIYALLIAPFLLGRRRRRHDASLVSPSSIVKRLLTAAGGPSPSLILD
jgi:hypothetical protein